MSITVGHSMRIRSPPTAFPIWQMGGAVARVEDSASAFQGRGAGHAFNISGMTEGPEGFEEGRLNQNIPPKLAWPHRPPGLSSGLHAAREQVG